MGTLHDTFTREQAAKREQAEAQGKVDDAIGKIVEILDGLSRDQQHTVLSDIARRTGWELTTPRDPHERGGPGDR
jgi:hypothetical protein